MREFFYIAMGLLFLMGAAAFAGMMVYVLIMNIREKINDRKLREKHESER